MKPTLFNLEVQTTQNEDSTIAEVDIDGIIGFDWWADEDEQNTKQKMREQLREINNIEADKIIVNISSLGGDVDHGLAIHDLLASNPATVETNVTGMTASAATLIAQAGDERYMSDNALYLVHRARTIGMGNANNFEDMAKELRKLDDRISNIYAKRSDNGQESFLELMNENNGDGIWISAEEAKDYGLIDTIAEPMKAAAIPREAFEKYNIPKPLSMKESNSNVSVNVTIDGSDIINAIKNTERELVKVGEDENFDEYRFKDEQEESSNEETASASSREHLEAKLRTQKQKYT